MSGSREKARHRARLRATAYHEAGHAVMACLEQQAFIRVTIRPKEGSLGHVRYRRDRRRPERYSLDQVRLDTVVGDLIPDGYGDVNRVP